jgi:hypothetical protein
MYTPHYRAGSVPANLLTGSGSEVWNEIHAPPTFKQLTNLEGPEVNVKPGTETSSRDGNNYTQDNISINDKSGSVDQLHAR